MMWLANLCILLKNQVWKKGKVIKIEHDYYD